MTKPKPTKYVFVEVSIVKGELIRDTVEYRLPINKLEEVRAFLTELERKTK